MDRRVSALLAATLLTCSAYVAGLLWVERPDSGYLTFWDGWLYFGAMGLVLALLAVRVLTERRHRFTWALVLAGSTATISADLVYTYHDQNLETWSFPSASDLLYLLAYPLWTAGVVRLSYHRANDVPPSAMLDGFAVGFTAAAFAVIVWFDPIAGQGGTQDDLRSAVTFATLDLILIMVAVASLAPYGYRPSAAAFGLIVSATLFGMGDLIYLSSAAQGTYVAGTALDSWWVLGTLGFSVAAWLPHRRHRLRLPDEPLPVSAGVAPAVAALVALGIVAAGLADAVPTLASAFAMGAIAIALARVLWSMHELRRANESYRLARTDDLTGLANRRAFLEAIDAMLADRVRPIHVLMLDLDGFKEVNDSLGHQAGDRLLQEVATRLRSIGGSERFLARLGGDEFGIAAASSAFDGVAAAEELVAAIAHPVEIDGLPVRVTASVGIATGSEASREDLLRMADVAMYEAKREGRPHVSYDEERDPHGRERLELIEDLRRAIEGASFHLEYQPIASAADGTIAAVEALVRWQRRPGELVPPAEFIPLAEQIGLIPQITRVVVRLAAAAAAELQRAGVGVPVHVNISARDLVDDALPEVLAEAMEANGIEGRALMLEVTETALVDDPVRSRRTLERVRRLGTAVAIDDFGVGYSSLNVLLELPVDQIKLDNSFIIGIEEHRRAQAIVVATVQVARSLGLTVVAEGVEAEAAATWVRAHGVDYLQGYHVERPLPLPALMSFLGGRASTGRVLAMSDDASSGDQPPAAAPAGPR